MRTKSRLQVHIVFISEYEYICKHTNTGIYMYINIYRSVY